jgi:predicted transcriptional regulator
VGRHAADSKWRSTKNEDRNRKAVTVTIDGETLERLDHLAGKRGMSRSALLEEALVEFLQRQKR